MRVSSGIQGELDLINQVFSDESTSEERVLEAAAALYKSGEKNIYARLLHVMCHLRLAPAEAKKTWEAIIRHRDTMESKLGRPTGFRVPMLDYFINESRELKKPKVIEIHVYAETARQAAVDELTGIFNRRFFDAAIEREVKQAARRNRELSLLIIDIDNFKRINDTHGHTTGDAVISALGKLLKRQIRSEDTPCRIGGEEFAVLLPETGVAGAEIVAEKIRHEFSKLKIASTDLSLSDFARNDVDVAIRYGQGDYPGLEAVRLMTEELFPVCSPALLRGSRPLAKPGDLQFHTLLHDDFQVDWRLWLLAAGVKGVDPARGPTFTDSSMVIQAAIEGQGVALARSVLSASDLAAGRLVKPFEVSMPASWAYYLVYPPATRDSPKIAAFRTWLLIEAQATTGAGARPSGDAAPTPDNAAR